MNRHSQWQSCEFSAASSYLRSRYVEEDISSLLFSSHSTPSLVETLLKHITKTKTKTSQDLLYWGSSAHPNMPPNVHKLSQVPFNQARDSSRYSFCLCSICKNICLTHQPAPQYMPMISLLQSSVHLFCLCFTVILSITCLHILSSSLPLFMSSLSPLSVWCLEDVEAGLSRCDVKQRYSLE